MLADRADLEAEYEADSADTGERSGTNRQNHAGRPPKIMKLFFANSAKGFPDIQWSAIG